MAVVYTLIETTKLNGVEPKALLTDVIGRVADHKSRGSMSCFLSVTLLRQRNRGCRVDAIAGSPDALNYSTPNQSFRRPAEV